MGVTDHELYDDREIVLEPYTESSQFRLAELADPAGTTVTFAPTLKGGQG